MINEDLRIYHYRAKEKLRNGMCNRFVYTLYICNDCAWCVVIQIIVNDS